MIIIIRNINKRTQHEDRDLPICSKIIPFLFCLLLMPKIITHMNVCTWQSFRTLYKPDIVSSKKTPCIHVDAFVCVSLTIFKYLYGSHLVRTYQSMMICSILLRLLWIPFHAIELHYDSFVDIDVVHKLFLRKSLLM